MQLDRNGRFLFTEGHKIGRFEQGFDQSLVKFCYFKPSKGCELPILIAKPKCEASILVPLDSPVAEGPKFSYFSQGLTVRSWRFMISSDSATFVFLLSVHLCQHQHIVRARFNDSSLKKSRNIQMSRRCRDSTHLVILQLCGLRLSRHRATLRRSRLNSGHQATFDQRVCPMIVLVDKSFVDFT